MLTAIKGESCRFVGGKYTGKAGWYDMANKSTKRMIFVIVEDFDDEGNDKSTRVYKENVGDYVEEQTYAEAVLYQHTDILKDMNRLCGKLAQCRLDRINENIIVEIFRAKLQLATRRNSGTKGRYRYVDWDPNPDEDL
jgi:hypothetical protein